MKSTITILTLILVEFSSSMLNSALGIPRMRLQKTLSEKFYDGDKSLLITRLEIASNLIMFVVSVSLIMFKSSQNSRTYKTRLLLLPAAGCFLSVASLSYLTQHQNSVSVLCVYVISLLPALTGESFLFETCISDIVADTVACKQQRVSAFLWVKGGKIVGLCVVQIMLPLMGVGENSILRYVSPAACALVIAVSALIAIIDKYVVAEPAAQGDEAEPFQNKNETVQPLPAVFRSTTTVVRSLTVYHGLLCLLVTLHSAQRGEYKFTYLFLSTHLNYNEAQLRLINGCQFLVFTVSLYTMGFVVKVTKHSSVTLIAFVLSMLFSVGARTCQIVAWELTRFDVWCLSAALSAPGPLAYQVVQQAMYKRLEDERLTGIVLITADKFVSIPFTQLYQVAYRDWHVCPFYVTLALMIVTTIVGISTQTMRAWLKG
jgi:hypothetical protein